MTYINIIDIANAYNFYISAKMAQRDCSINRCISDGLGRLIGEMQMLRKTSIRRAWMLEKCRITSKRIACLWLDMSEKLEDFVAQVSHFIPLLQWNLITEGYVHDRITFIYQLGDIVVAFSSAYPTIADDANELLLLVHLSQNHRYGSGHTPTQDMKEFAWTFTRQYRNTMYGADWHHRYGTVEAVLAWMLSSTIYTFTDVDNALNVWYKGLSYATRTPKHVEFYRNMLDCLDRMCAIRPFVRAQL
jgi:hypothetical protein